jgi:hypothetical protein
MRPREIATWLPIFLAPAQRHSQPDHGGKAMDAKHVEALTFDALDTAREPQLLEPLA